MKSLRHFDSLQQVQDYGLQPRDALYLEDLRVMNHLVSEELEDSELFISADTTILERAYHSIEPAEVAAAQKHMSATEKRLFEAMLNKHKTVFDGELGHYPHERIHIELTPGAVPVHKRAYQVPYQREELFK